jgi:cytochrome c-type biogenesis protein CcmE
MEVGRGMTYYYEVDEVTPETAPRNFKLSGKVDPGSIVRDPAKGTLSFVLAGGVHKYPVVYKGVVPDIFRDGIQVVVEGGFTPDGSFSAHSLLAKCPSKYIPKGKAEDFITPLYP